MRDRRPSLNYFLFAVDAQMFRLSGLPVGLKLVAMVTCCLVLYE